MRSIVIAHQTVIDGDAIGNDILGMYAALKKNGSEVYIFAENYMGLFHSFQGHKGAGLKALQDDNCILIYHHSIFWKQGEEILSQCKGKIFFKFHNITPPGCFKKYSSEHYEKCMKGIEQTKDFITNYPSGTWLVDSEYNNISIRESGLKKDSAIILPPFNNLEAIEKIEPDYSIISRLINNKKNNILFVGRIAPNKGHIHLINIIVEYMERYDASIHLWLIGPSDDLLQKYHAELNDLIERHDIQNNITFTDKLPPDAIKSYYLTCDEFLCMSEHEGFCVPIVEAQKMMLPVITLGSSALQHTAGNNQIILNHIDYAFAASALYTVYTDRNIKRFCQENGLTNANSRFLNPVIEQKFIEIITRQTGGE